MKDSTDPERRIWVDPNNEANLVTRHYFMCLTAVAI